MDKSGHHKTQKGFFDLGISLILLTIFGTTVAVVDANHDESDPQHIACADLSQQHSQNKADCH